MKVQVTFGAPLRIHYTNHEGRTEWRCVEVERIWWGSTEWHPTAGWMLTARDMDRNVWRDFSMRDIDAVEVVE